MPECHYDSRTPQGIHLPERAAGIGLVLLAAILTVGSARAATFTVNSTADGGDQIAGNGTCATAPPTPVCTLRAAIEEANALAGPDVIQFNISPGGLQTLTPGGAYPTILTVMTIDATTQPGYAGTPIIEINGAGAGGNNAFTLSGAGSSGTTIRGLAIGQFGVGLAIRIINSSNNVVVGNYLGTDPTGTVARANGVGVFIQNATNNQIGGTAGADRNVISGNSPDGIQITGAGSTGNIIEGNYIGLDAGGTTALGNAANGIAIFGGADNNTVGGTAAGAGNVVSGNGNLGIGIAQAGTTGNVVQGNLIGTNPAGTAPIPNLHGVALQATASGNTIGGAGAGAGNVISGNNSNGILIDNASTNTVQRNRIGTDLTGTADVGNNQHGIQIFGGATNNLIGGASGDGNVISGNNLNGLDIVQSGTTGNRVAGNIIGLDVSGTVDLGNTDFGVAVAQGATGNIIGEVGGGNVISGNDRAGVRIVDAGTNNNLVQLNYIGLDVSGTLARPNSAEGVILDAGGAATGNVIGGSGLGNVISGNGGAGVRILNNMTVTSVVANIIGRDAADSVSVPNSGGGIRIENSSGNTIGGTAAGTDNTIAGNTGAGIAVVGASTGNALLANRVFSNSSLGIDLGDDGVTGNDIGDLDTGPNDLQNYLVLSGATTNGTTVHVAGSLDSAPSTTYRVEFFANSTTIGPDPSGFGEGERYLDFANVTTDVNGYAVVAVTLSKSVAAGETLSATATDPSNNTSEFAANVMAVGDLVVTTTSDTVDGTITSVSALITDPGTDGRISLREAIRATNATAGLDTIRFGIPLTDSGHFYYRDDAPGPSLTDVQPTTLAAADITDFDSDYPTGLARSWYRIEPASSMTSISDALIIDGSTQPGALVNGPVVEVKGTSAGAGGRGLTVPAGPSSVTFLGLIVNEFDAEGITSLATSTTIQGCYVGTDPSGTLAQGNGIGGAGAGIYVGGDGSQVGGPTLAERNIISGNLTDGLWIDADNINVEGNYIGTSVTGTADVGNGLCGVVLQTVVSATVTNVTVGGTAAGALNVISGNDQDGVRLQGGGVQSNTIQGNYIGTDVTGKVALPNTVDGMRIGTDVSLNQIGGTAAGARNVISGNGDDGMFLGNNATNNVVEGNYIGVDVTGVAALGNATHGISLGPVGNNRIGGTAAGAGNVIAYNSAHGIRTGAVTLTGNSILSNSIYSNGGRGIDLSADGVTPNDLGDVDAGPNDLLNWPFIYLVSESGGTLTVDFSLDLPAGSYRIEFFKNPSGADGSGNGEGEVFASSVNVTHAGAGSQPFSHSFPGAAGDAVTATTTFCTDGASCTAFGDTSEFSNVFIEGVTAVELTSFTAAGVDGAVDLSWQTSSELNNLGFHLYRASSESGPYARITTTAIPGLGSSPTGGSYSFRDDGLTNGVTYYYKLEDVDTVGRSELHGPVSATPRAETSDSSAEELGDSRITVGEPSASSLKVLRRSNDELVLELLTGGFFAEPQEDGSVRLSIPGFDALMGTDAPGIPVKHTWVDAIAGRRVKLVSVTPEDEEAVAGLRPSVAERPEVVVGHDGTVRAMRRRGSRGPARGARPEGAGVYPSESARIVSVGFQEDVKKALLELTPLRWNGSKKQLLLTHRLVVRLSFRGREPSEDTTDGVRGRRRRTVRGGARKVAVRLVTKKRGLYGVSFEDAFGGGRQRVVFASELRVTRQGEVVAYHLEPDPDRFGPGSRLYFVSNGARANPYGNEAVYELELDGEGRVMEQTDASPKGEAVSYYWHTLQLEENHYYQAALLDAPDLWLWELIMAPSSKTFPFHVEGLAGTTEPSRLKVWLQGASDLPGSPDHHVRLYLNHVFVGELSWDGKQAKELVETIPGGALRAGDNLLEIENVGDTAATYSMVMLDRFEVVYPKRVTAVGGQLEGSWTASGVAEFSGLGAKPLLVDTTEPDPRWLSGVQPGADGTARARVELGRRYLAVSPDSVLRPEVRKVRRSGLMSERHRADYLLITPDAFLPAIAPLIELRRNQGLHTEAVAVEDVYSEFGFGEARPEAIKNFLSYAYHVWQRPSPRYVVLVGDATYDFKDYLGTGVTNRIPPLMLATSYLWTASDPSYAMVNGDDALPDLAIGRLPASSVEEARAMVEKILAFETGEANPDTGPLVLVADNADQAGDFRADAEGLASSTLAGRDIKKIYLSDLGLAMTRESIREAFDQGASVLSYMGHGGIHLWASENLFDISAVGSLSPQPQQPIVLTMNCLNGYFHFPYFNSLAEALVKARGKGAVAAFSPSGLSLNDSAHLYHQALLEELLQGNHERLGDAVMAAQQVYAHTGALPELLSIYHLFGDPALKIR